MPSVIFDLQNPITSRFVKRHLRKEARTYLGLSKWSPRFVVKDKFTKEFITKPSANPIKDRMSFLEVLNPTQVHQAKANEGHHLHLAIMDMYNNVSKAILGF